jgi:BASS family bile acid:Na+ symporter
VIENIDQIQINFSPTTLRIVNFLIGLVMFGVALDLKFDDFKTVLGKPKAFLLGQLSQFFLLPAAACLIIKFFDPLAGLALGVVIISACPGGNISNFLTNFSGGNTALSICMSTLSTLMAIFMTPFNITFWGAKNPAVASILREVNLDFWAIFNTVLVILVIPTFLGVSFARSFPVLTQKIKKWFLIGSFLLFSALIFGALFANLNNFVRYFSHFFGIVITVNTVALLIGIFMGKLGRLNSVDTRAITFEIGIQNAAFGLVIVFNFFDEMGSAAIICAFWGIWHVLSGVSLALFWKKYSGTETQTGPMLTKEAK